MSVGHDYGWGICGRYLTKELSKLCDVRLVSEELDLEKHEDRPELSYLGGLLMDPKEIEQTGAVFPNPVLQAIQGHNLKPWYVEVQEPRPIGYTFFEIDRLDPDDVRRAADYYEIIVAGSTWCQKILAEHGFPHTETIIQGVDGELFHPKAPAHRKYRDKFVIFSGGKFELRKGQDLVIKAFRVLQEKYPDVLLVNLWYNRWRTSIETMQISPYIRFESSGNDYFQYVNHLLSINDVDLRGVVTLPPLGHHDMPEIYRDTDVGLFPNRCEGGTNLVMMEYMACGKPVIASYTSGHRDILSRKNAIPATSVHPFTVQNREHKILYRWEEPDLDEIISLLEWAYWHREECQYIGEAAGKDLSKMTWAAAAWRFYELIFH
jgi:glycosyltransferase involved in cell wall biosynthesis